MQPARGRKSHGVGVAQWLPKVFQWVQEHGGDPVIPFSGVLENKLLDMPDDEKEKYCKEVRASLSEMKPLLPCCCRHLPLSFLF